MSTDAIGTAEVDVTAPEDRALKARHRTLWASGDYARVAAELIPGLGPELVDAAGVTAGQDALDVAAGAGNAAVPAAVTGARVTASDLTPELFAARPRRGGSRSPGPRRTPRPCRSTTRASTSCCPASGRCSRRGTR
jgi:SAM-dependent methyltransferase